MSDSIEETAPPPDSRAAGGRLHLLVVRWWAYWQNAQASYRRAERVVCLCKTQRYTVIIIRNNRQFSKHARQHQKRMKRLRRAFGGGFGDYQIDRLMETHNAPHQATASE